MRDKTVNQLEIKIITYTLINYQYITCDKILKMKLWNNSLHNNKEIGFQIHEFEKSHPEIILNSQIKKEINHFLCIYASIHYLCTCNKLFVIKINWTDIISYLKISDKIMIDILLFLNIASIWDCEAWYYTCYLS